MGQNKKSPINIGLWKLRKFASILISAYMIGISNVVLEEDRMIQDTTPQIEQQELQNNEDIT
ncbi:hypothetical protein M3P19_00305 [Muricauda sp. 2012CJ35-5]|uniref:Uncharacterized protein n=1 Tax=Flagellimonas spongiicola TaxID=2942208 RepID=A0ABT0PM29_9FLAO|nr:hypothetical protein [Allomuricauda spongiicola]MCL6272424.1 hypothetical protein [Allomuricauda spongiicola]